ncbi:hypothetical protein [Mycolicibacterium fortuitum]|uniref:hypothetical protein n=1 Tax=Mycolicibacterium fortuitum TaxID=1766 RepID=UPI003AAE7E4F
MDISDMMMSGNASAQPEVDKNTAPPHQLDVDDSPPEVDEAFDTAAQEMSAVERIRAYRANKLEMPTIGQTNTEPHDSAEQAQEYIGVDHDVVDNAAPNDSVVDSGSGLISDGPSGAPSAKGWNGLRVDRRKALMIGIPILAVVAAGIAIPGKAEKDNGDDSVSNIVSQSASDSSPAESTTAVAPVDVIADDVIQPAKVEAAEYPISLTPPMDAFTPGGGKAWVCAGLDGTVLTITLPTLTAVSEIKVLPGFEGRDKDGSDQWAKHRIVTSAMFYLDYGDPIPAGPDGQGFVNKKEQQSTPMHGAMTKTIRMVILGTESVAPEAPATGEGQPKPGIFGDLGKLGLDPAQPTPASTDNRPATFAIGGIEIVGHPAR